MFSMILIITIVIIILVSLDFFIGPNILGLQKNNNKVVSNDGNSVTNEGNNGIGGNSVTNGGNNVNNGIGGNSGVANGGNNGSNGVDGNGGNSDLINVNAAGNGGNNITNGNMNGNMNGNESVAPGVDETGMNTNQAQLCNSWDVELRDISVGLLAKQHYDNFGPSAGKYIMFPTKIELIKDDGDRKTYRIEYNYTPAPNSSLANSGKISEKFLFKFNEDICDWEIETILREDSVSSKQSKLDKWCRKNIGSSEMFARKDRKSGENVNRWRCYRKRALDFSKMRGGCVADNKSIVNCYGLWNGTSPSLFTRSQLDGLI